MDLVSGAKRLIVAMQHTAKGKSKIVRKCDLPLTSQRPVEMVVTDLAVITLRTQPQPCWKQLLVFRCRMYRGATCGFILDAIAMGVASVEFFDRRPA